MVDVGEAVASRRRAWLSEHPELFSLLGLVVLAVAMTFLSDRFLSWENIGNIGRQVSINVIIAMTIYTIALLVRTVADALGAVSEETAQAAVAMGYTPIRRFFGVELPLAVPVMARRYGRGSSPARRA